jgi:hypothetical protein
MEFEHVERKEYSRIGPGTGDGLSTYGGLSGESESETLGPSRRFTVYPVRKHGKSMLFAG